MNSLIFLNHSLFYLSRGLTVDELSDELSPINEFNDCNENINLFCLSKIQKPIDDTDSLPYQKPIRRSRSCGSSHNQDSENLKTSDESSGFDASFDNPSVVRPSELKRYKNRDAMFSTLDLTGSAESYKIEEFTKVVNERLVPQLLSKCYTRGVSFKTDVL